MSDELLQTFPSRKINGQVPAPPGPAGFTPQIPPEDPEEDLLEELEADAEHEVYHDVKVRQLSRGSQGSIPKKLPESENS